MGSLVNLEIASLNCNGLTEPAKRKVIFEFFERSNYLIVFLQETHFDPSQHCDIIKEWTNGPIFLNSVFGKVCGTEILFNTFQFKIKNDLYDLESRVISVDIEFYGNRFHLVNSYFPNENSKKLEFIQNSYKYVMSNFPTIWGGDFNLTDDNLIDRWPAKSTQDTHTGFLKKVVETFNLVDSCRFIHPNQPMYTYKRQNKGSCSMSRIDRLLVSKHFDIMAFDKHDCELSDHELISVQVQFQSKMVFGKRPWRNNTKLFKSDSFLDNFESFWTNLKVKKCALFYGNINKWWNEAKYDTKRKLMTLGKSFSLYERREIDMMKNTLNFLLEMLNLNPNNKMHIKQYFEYKKSLVLGS